MLKLLQKPFNKTKDRRPKPAVFYSLSESTLDRSTYGANTSASTTFDASISVDDVLAVTLRDSGNRAFTCASAASDAFISNHICHSVTHLLAVSVSYFISICAKKQVVTQKIQRFPERLATAYSSESSSLSASFRSRLSPRLPRPMILTS